MSIIAVLRHAEERTLTKSRAFLKSQVGKLTLVKEHPFFEAVKRTFEIGAKESVDLLLAVDADVIVELKAVEKIVSYWERVKKQNFALSRMDFLVRDKFRGRVFAGCHLYNNRYSEQVYDFLSNIDYDPNQKRPESANLAKFRKVFGLSSKDCKKFVVGKHDFEQYYKHIYAKYYNRAIRDHKSYDKIYSMIDKKRRDNPEDYDFVIALKAMEHARREEQATMNTDASQYFDITDLLNELGIKEKEPLDV